MQSPPPTGATFALVLVWDTVKDECGWREPPLPAYHWGTQAALEEQVVDILLPPQLLSMLCSCRPSQCSQQLPVAGTVCGQCFLP